MTNDTSKGAEEFKSDLWRVAGKLGASSKHASCDYFMPVPGVIFLLLALDRVDSAH